MDYTLPSNLFHLKAILDELGDWRIHNIDIFSDKQSREFGIAYAKLINIEYELKTAPLPHQTGDEKGG